MAIISFRYGFVFVKTTKTAGTSIEVELSKVAGPDDVVTPVLPPEPGHVARNYTDTAGNTLFYNHMPAGRIREIIGADRFDEMTVFCVEREPVEKCISHFHMQRNSSLHNPDGAYQLSWAEFVEAGRFPVDLHKYAEGPPGARRLIVDQILRYDRLDYDLPALMARFGIEDFALRARAKAEYSRNRLVRPGDVTADQRARIYDAFAETLEVSGIRWEA